MFVNTVIKMHVSSEVGKPKHMAADVNCSGGGGGGGWPVGEELKAAEEELSAAIDPASKWKHEDVERAGQKMGLPLSQTGSWRRGMTAQVGITPPRTKGTTGTFKSIGTPCLLCSAAVGAERNYMTGFFLEVC